jgi:hypothetical protein
MFRLPKTGLVLPFLSLLFLTPAVRADQFTATGYILSFHSSGSHYTFDTFGSGTPTGDFHGRGRFDLDSSTGLITNGEVAYVNGNGDFLVLAFQGSIDASGVIQEAFDIVSGTGQFNGATGSGLIYGQLNADGSVVYFIDGVIN